ncbi:aminotransferase [Mesorhizobium sp. ORM6]
MPATFTYASTPSGAHQNQSERERLWLHRLERARSTSHFICTRRRDPQSHVKAGPYIAARGDGCHIIDEHGNRYVDAMGGLWCATLGFNNKRLADVAFQQYNELGYYHSFYGRTNDKVSLLAKKLIELTGFSGGKVYFATSGSEANETMVKFSWLYHAARGKPTKRKIIARDRAFHGSTIVASSMCGLEFMHREFGLPLPGFLHTLCPNSFRVRLEGESDEDFVKRLTIELERLILREGPDTIAAFIAEPVNAGGGIIVPPDGYFPAVKAVLDKYDILLLDDEVVCGFGRTGNWFGAETVGMKPHMMSFAKGITSSYFPMSAVVISPEIYEAIESFNKNGGSLGHGFTNGGHPVGAAIALETIAIYEEMDVLSHVRAMGGIFDGLLRQACEGSSIVGDIRGSGLMRAIEFVEDTETNAPFSQQRLFGPYFQQAAYDEGLIIRMMRDIAGFCPPLIANESTIEEIVEKFEKTLRKAEGKFGLDRRSAA